MLLAVGAPMAWMLAQLHAQQGDLGIVRGFRLPAAAANGCVAHDLAHRRGEVAARMRVPGAEALRDPHVTERGHRRGDLDGRDPPDLAVDREDHRSRLLLGASAHVVQDDRRPGATAARNEKDIAWLERSQRLDGGIPAPVRRVAGEDLLAPGEGLAQLGILLIVAQMAGHGLAKALEGVLVLARLGRESDDRAIRLELREGGLEDLARRMAAQAGNEIHRHVVRGLERRPQRVGAGRGETGEGPWVETGVPEHDSVALDVDAPAPGPPGQLGVLPRRQLDVGLAVPLHQLLEHHGAGRHVDAEGQGLGREDHLEQPRLEQVLDDLLECREQAGMMGGDPALEALDPFVEPQCGEVLVREAPGQLEDTVPHPRSLLARIEPKSRREALLHGVVAAGAAEEEVDRREQSVALEALDDIAAIRRVRRPRTPVAASRLRVGGARAMVLVAGETNEIGVHELLIVVDEQVVHLRSGDDVLPQRNGPVLLDDDVGVAAHGREPGPEFLGIADGRGERCHGHRLREVDDDLLPHGPAEPVREVVHLVHDDVGEVAERRRAGIEHVAEHLGGHDDNGRLPVDAGVAGEEADVVLAVPCDEIAVLLVRQRLDRGGVEALAARGEGEVDGELPDDRLARAGRSRDEHPASGLEGLAGALLEVVEPERVEVRERGELRVPTFRPLDRGGIAFSGRDHDPRLRPHRPLGSRLKPGLGQIGSGSSSGEVMSSSNDVKSGSPARRRARRRSFRTQMPTAIPTRMSSGPPRRRRLMGSPVGVATAAKMNTPKMIHLHQEMRRAPLRTPAKLSSTSRRGSRNPTPKTRIVRMKKDR